MSSSEQSALIDRLRALPSETEWCEFKRNLIVRTLPSGTLFPLEIT